MRPSVIVSTYNGAGKLPLLLEAIAVQTYRDFQLVVVIDGSTDNTAEIVEKYRLIFHNLKVVYQENAGRSRVRNRGALESSGDLLIFYDDDMVPSEYSVQQHLNIHSNPPEVLVAGNPIELEDPSKPDVQNYKASRVQMWTQKYLQPVTEMTLQNLFFTAANCSMRKSLFLRLGGFDERLTDAEDFDLARRAVAMGVPVLFDKTNVAIHRDFISARGYLLRLRQYAEANRRIVEMSGLSHRQSGPVDNVFKRMVYKALANRIWINLIDSQILLFLPKNLRYKLYDAILHSLSVVHPVVRV